MSKRRTPYDGEPFYCTYCGIGFGEFMACEDLNCQLETKLAAEQRQRRHIAKPEDDE